MKIALKRVYDSPSMDDGYRILVDRLWPRGLSKAQARIDAWLKDLAPSAALRQWFGHDPGRALDAGPVTLLYAAKDTTHNNAVALRDYLLREPR